MPTHSSTLPANRPQSVCRFLLQCRFDYRQRSWQLPAPSPARAGDVREASEPANSAAVLAALSALASESSR